jgi:hypothetical protein
MNSYWVAANSGAVCYAPLSCCAKVLFCRKHQLSVSHFSTNFRRPIHKWPKIPQAAFRVNDFLDRESFCSGTAGFWQFAEKDSDQFDAQQNLSTLKMVISYCERL